MLCSVNYQKGFDIVGTSGEIGAIEEFYFDDEQSAVRYIIVNTGSRPSDRQVLISPFSVTHVDRDNRKLHVSLTQDQVKKSPNIDTHKPVSRQIEATHSEYYGYSYYWGGPFLWGATERPILASQESATAKAATAMSISAAHPSAKAVTATGRLSTVETIADMRVTSADVHLRSTNEVASYHIAATDGEIGHVEDFILEDDSWAIRYLAINTRNWLPGKKVIVSLQQISLIDRVKNKVHVNLSREQIKRSPEYDISKLISLEFERELDRYYSQTHFWLN